MLLRTSVIYSLLPIFKLASHCSFALLLFCSILILHLPPPLLALSFYFYAFFFFLALSFCFFTSIFLPPLLPSSSFTSSRYSVCHCSSFLVPSFSLFVSTNPSAATPPLYRHIALLPWPQLLHSRSNVSFLFSNFVI